MTDALRYPIGRFERPSGSFDNETRQALIGEIERLPRLLRDSVLGVPDAQLDVMTYRPGGWTVRQVVHHVPDSHMNAYIRMKLAVTEGTPAVKPYAENRWAELADAKAAPIAVSLGLLDALHFRWTMFLRALRPEEFERAYLHPENGLTTIDGALALYAWHGRHHLAHVQNALSQVLRGQ